MSSKNPKIPPSSVDPPFLPLPFTFLPSPLSSLHSLHPLIPVSVFAHCSIVSPCGWIQSITEPFLDKPCHPRQTLSLWPFQPSELHSSETLPRTYRHPRHWFPVQAFSSPVAHNIAERHLYFNGARSNSTNVPSTSTSLHRLRVAPFLIRSTLGPCQLHNQLFCPSLLILPPAARYPVSNPTRRLRHLQLSTITFRTKDKLVLNEWC